MKFFSGFCVDVKKDFFNEYLEKSDFVVAGFSFGAQKALDYVLSTSNRVDKLQLLSPAFFDYNEKLIDINLRAFKKDKKNYIKKFLTKAGINKWKIENENWVIDIDKINIAECSERDLKELFSFNWNKIQKVKNIKIEVFLGEYDKIIALRKAYDFFKNYADIYFIKNANHFLRR